jgi:hypothetical protein
MSPLVCAGLLTLAAVPEAVELYDSPYDVEITGWSADETRFAARKFISPRNDDSDKEPPSCPGYVDQKGKPFTGSLMVAAYKNGSVVQSWVIQDYPACTPPAKAKATLAEAKKKFADLGIDLSKKGTQLPCKTTCDLKHNGATLVLEDATTSTEDEKTAQTRTHGAVRVWLRNGKSKKLLFETNVDETYYTVPGQLFIDLEPIEVSPTGKSLLVWVTVTRMNRGVGESQRMEKVGFFSWEGDALVKRE